MGGAKNCPETPRQKMIGMMYLVLTAMLALNVSADILNGFSMVDNSLLNSIRNANIRNEGLHDDMQYLYEQNPQKVGEGLEKSKRVKEESDKMFNLLQEFKTGIIRLADGKEADTAGIIIVKKDNLDVAGQYAELSTTGARGQQLKDAIKNYRIFVEEMFDNDSNKVQIYESMFNTDPSENSHGEVVDWVNATFESMPAVAVITMLSKYQSDVRATEAELINYFKSKTDAGDFRVNKITAKLIPVSKHVIQGGRYHAEIALMAVDTTKVPEYYLNGNKLDTCIVDFACGSIGTFPIKGQLELTDQYGEKQVFPFEDEYSVGAPSATIANVDMNVVYRGYKNKMEISVPGISSDKLRVSAQGGTIVKEGQYYICTPSAASEIVLTVSAEVEGRVQSMGSSKFRVKTLPNPTAFLSINGESWLPGKSKVTRNQIVEGTMIAEYEDGMLNANFKVTGFILSISDGKGGFNSSPSNGNKFTDDQQRRLRNLKPGTKVLIENVKFTGPKSGTLAFPPITLP